MKIISALFLAVLGLFIYSSFFISYQVPPDKITSPLCLVIWQDKSLSVNENAVDFINFENLVPIINERENRQLTIFFGLIDSDVSGDVLRLELKQNNTPLPPKKNGFTATKYLIAKKEFEKQYSKYVEDSLQISKREAEDIESFRSKMKSMIKDPLSQWTDLFGALVLTDKLLNEIPRNTHKYILFFSDGMQSHNEKSKNSPYRLRTKGKRILVNSSTQLSYSIDNQIDIEFESAAAAVKYIIEDLNKMEK
jgi:hypothetical protein